MNVRMLGGEELADKWYIIKPLVEKSLVHGTGDISSYDLFIEGLGAITQFWVREDNDEIIGVAVTRIVTHKQYKEFVIVCTTSKGWFNHGPDILELLEQFARGVGCKYASVCGRRGWTRVLKKHGYYEPYTRIVKEL